ncbi:MAG TPA: patatin-like phospholipase family protein [Alphaproteobacteria bacterium]|nr:patatin-like phospholipase family protein [Alphaproteobacteria bacterium]
MQYQSSKLTEQLHRWWRSTLMALRLGRRQHLPSVLEPPSPAPRWARAWLTTNPVRSAGFAKNSCRLALALQGGGAHGAFTWGVLDRLLEVPGCRIVAISGSSAGAINAAVLAAGYLEGGPVAARERLEALWRKLAQLAEFSPLRPTPFEALVLGRNSEWSFSHLAFDLVSRLWSPYQLNPLGLNPLRQVLVELIDFERLRGSDAIRLFVAATCVESGAARLFTNRELTPEVLLASACLPALYPAVKLEGRHYWDGGFTANPPLLPLVEQCDASDIVLVRLNPRQEVPVPTTARGIQSRLSRIVFDNPLKRELESIDWLRRMAKKAGIGANGPAERLASLRLHTIGDDDALSKLGSASKLHPDWPLVRALRDAGREAAEGWLFAGVTPRPAANDQDEGAAGLAV